jgi:hypothetical protein
VTLEEAQAQGYEVLSGPYTQREEQMMLSAKEALDQNPSIRSKLVTLSNRWYLVRTDMIEVPPEVEGAPSKRRVRLQVVVNETLMGFVKSDARRRFRGSLGLAVEEALIKKYAPHDRQLMEQFRRSVREVVKRFPKIVGESA